MAPNARKSVLEIKNGVDPSTTAILSFMPATGTTMACDAFKVP
jgi:hypothetical protein